MSIRSSLAVIALVGLPLLACGGGAKEEAAPPPGPAATAAAPAAPAGGGATTGTASISGKISFEGTAPAPEKIKTSADPKCQAMHPQGLERQTVDASGGGLKDVLVYVKSGVSGTYPAPAEPVLLDQKGCMYHPHIITVQAGQPLKIRNSDDTLHNIHPRPTTNPEFNIGQPRQGMESTKTFDKPEVPIPVGCDVHPWMRSYIAVLNHPFFAVTKEDGTYEIKGLPAGEYEIEAWHEKLKTQTQKVTVKDGEKAKADFSYKG
jgi:Carboxypeptidase regulatory-like domain